MKRLNIYVTLLTVALGLSSASRAQEITSLSLQDCMSYALKNNAKAKNARLDLALQKAKNAEITGLALPQINVKDEYNYYIKPVVSFFPADLLKAFDPTLANLPPGSFVPVTFTPKYGNTLSASGSQILFDGSVLVALQAKNTLIKLSELSVLASEEEVRYNVYKSYYSLVLAKRQFGLLSQSIGNLRNIANDMVAMKEQGFVEKIEVDRTTVQLNNLITDSLRTANLILLSEQLLKFNIGMDINREIVLSDTAFSGSVMNAANILSNETNYEIRNDYKLLQTQLKLNEYDLKRYRYKGLPSVAAFGNAAYTFSSNEFKDVATPHNYVFYSLVGLQLNMPIFTGLQRVNQVKQARLNIEKTLNTIDNLKLVIDLQSAQSRTSLKNSLSSFQNQERNLLLANSVLDLAHKKYKEGVGSNLEVTQAQSDLLQAQNNYFQSMLDVINAQADLQRALGLFNQ